jgi:hypothetical protein
MQTFKPSGEELEQLRNAAITLAKANALSAASIKQVEASKKAISEWLKQKRGLELETLPIGELVQIEGVVLIEISKQNKFDEARFMLADPKTYEAYKGDRPVKKFKPLV